MNQPELWLRGPVAAVPPALQPVAHALLQALEEIEALVPGIGPDDLWRSFAGAATVGFHLRHLAGSTDRLFTYARGEALTIDQRRFLAAEKDVTPEVPPDALLRDLRHVIDAALDQLRATPDDVLDQPRGVGRAGLPSTVRGLLHHAGEHAARHAGQIATTVKFLRGAGASSAR